MSDHLDEHLADLQSAIQAGEYDAARAALEEVVAARDERSESTLFARSLAVGSREGLGDEAADLNAFAATATETDVRWSEFVLKTATFLSEPDALEREAVVETVERLRSTTASLADQRESVESRVAEATIPAQPQIVAVEGSRRLQPGSSSTLSVPVSNVGDEPTSALTLSASPSEGLSVSPSSVSIESVEPEGTQTVELSLSAAESATGSLSLGLALEDDSGVVGSRSVTVRIAPAETESPTTPTPDDGTPGSTPTETPSGPDSGTARPTETGNSTATESPTGGKAPAGTDPPTGMEAPSTGGQSDGGLPSWLPVVGGGAVTALVGGSVAYKYLSGDDETTDPGPARRGGSDGGGPAGRGGQSGRGGHSDRSGQSGRGGQSRHGSHSGRGGQSGGGTPASRRSGQGRGGPGRGTGNRDGGPGRSSDERSGQTGRSEGARLPLKDDAGSDASDDTGRRSADGGSERGTDRDDRGTDRDDRRRR